MDVQTFFQWCFRCVSGFSSRVFQGGHGFSSVSNDFCFFSEFSFNFRFFMFQVFCLFKCLSVVHFFRRLFRVCFHGCFNGFSSFSIVFVCFSSFSKDKRRFCSSACSSGSRQCPCGRTSGCIVQDIYQGEGGKKTTDALMPFHFSRGTANRPRATGSWRKNLRVPGRRARRPRVEFVWRGSVTMQMFERMPHSSRLQSAWMLVVRCAAAKATAKFRGLWGGRCRVEVPLNQLGRVLAVRQERHAEVAGEAGETGRSRRHSLFGCCRHSRQNCQWRPRTQTALIDAFPIPRGLVLPAFSQGTAISGSVKTSDAGVALSTTPPNPPTPLESHLLHVMILRRLRYPLPFFRCVCR